MRTLNFKINGQRLSKDGDFSNIIKGTKGYLKCAFKTDDKDWINCRIIAVFETPNYEDAVVLKADNTCVIPDKITDSDYFRLHVVGTKTGDNNYMIITNKELISQEG